MSWISKYKNKIIDVRSIGPKSRPQFYAIVDGDYFYSQTRSKSWQQAKEKARAIVNQSSCKPISP